ncbi:hypothetical protein D9M68_621380 [compost metagenome]
MQQEGLRIGQPQRGGGAGQLQVDAAGAQPGLAAHDAALAEFDAAVGAEGAARHALEHGQVALQHRQFQLGQVPAGLAAPVAPVAGAVQVIVAEAGLDHQRARAQRRRARFQRHGMARAVAAGVEEDFADIELRQAGLLVEPAQPAVGQRHAALRHQPAQETVVFLLAAGGIDRHAADQQLALGCAAHQDVGAGGAQADELQVHAEQRAPRQLAVERGGRQQHALAIVHGAQVAGAEGGVPAVPVGIERTDGDLCRQRERAAFLQPFARGRCLRPEHEADQQARRQRQHAQHQRQPYQRAPQAAPERVAHHANDRARAGAGEAAQARKARRRARQGRGIGTWSSQGINGWWRSGVVGGVVGGVVVGVVG